MALRCGVGSTTVATSCWVVVCLAWHLALKLFINLTFTETCMHDTWVIRILVLLIKLVSLVVGYTLTTLFHDTFCAVFKLQDHALLTEAPCGAFRSGRWSCTGHRNIRTCSVAITVLAIDHWVHTSFCCCDYCSCETLWTCCGC